MTQFRAFLIFIMMFGAFSQTAYAALPDEVLADPILEARARNLSKTLRCVVCKNQSIDDSNAPLARDMRLLVRERLVTGDSDSQVRDYLVARYGNFILLRPPLQPNTLLLWLAPAIFTLLGFIGFAIFMRRSKAIQAEQIKPLSPEEQTKLAKIEQGQEK